MLPTLKNNAAAAYRGPVKIEPLKGAGLLTRTLEVIIIYFMPFLFVCLFFFLFLLGLNDVCHSLQDTGNKEAHKLESVMQPHEETIISNLHFPDSVITFVKVLTV